MAIQLTDLALNKNTVDKWLDETPEQHMCHCHYDHKSRVVAIKAHDRLGGGSYLIQKDALIFIETDSKVMGVIDLITNREEVWSKKKRKMIKTGAHAIAKYGYRFVIGFTAIDIQELERTFI